MEVRMKGWALAGVAGAIAVIAACGSDANQVTGTPPVNNNARGTSGGKDTSGSSGNGTPTSNGPVTGIVITPHALAMVVGNYATLVAAAHDAAGVLVVKKATWRSSDPSTVVPSDTGVIFGKAIGVATVYATVDGFTDSSIVVVERTIVQTPQPVSQFNMTVVALGAIAGADTSHAERLSGATVTLQRIGGVTGDTLKTPVDAGFATTNANGEAKFTNLTGGSYSIRITPAAGSPYQETTSGIFPPRLNDITVNVTLRRP
jgi:hypothetical protein